MTRQSLVIAAALIGAAFGCTTAQAQPARAANTNHANRAVTIGPTNAGQPRPAGAAARCTDGGAPGRAATCRRASTRQVARRRTRADQPRHGGAQPAPVAPQPEAHVVHVAAADAMDHEALGHAPQLEAPPAAVAMAQPVTQRFSSATAAIMLLHTVGSQPIQPYRPTLLALVGFPRPLEAPARVKHRPMEVWRLPGRPTQGNTSRAPNTDRVDAGQAPDSGLPVELAAA